MGLPVVASRLPGIAGYFGDGDLATFVPGDENDLARAIEYVCADPDWARERARSATKQLSEIAWKSQRARYLGLVDELVTRLGHLRFAVPAPAR
jgi:glycosyltransferase involved in cell wall biosynthesis